MEGEGYSPSDVSSLARLVRLPRFVPENCERWYQYPLPESSPAELGDELSTGANIPWKPQCGCEFKKFNSDTGECGAGSVHQSSLTRMTHSDGVYYFVNEKGEGMMVRQSEKITDGHALVLDKDLDGTIAECRSRSDCAAAQFEVNHARNKTELMSAQCMSPCYFKDYWGRVSYHVDHTNQWAEPSRLYQDVERAITVRFDVHVPSGAALARCTVSSPTRRRQDCHGEYGEAPLRLTVSSLAACRGPSTPRAWSRDP